MGTYSRGYQTPRFIKVYTPEGKPLHRFKFNIPANPVSENYIKEAKYKVLDDIKDRPLSKTVYQMIAKGIMKTDFKELFGDYLPFYRQILVDSEGNILVFRWPGSVGKVTEVFQVYSPDGKYICDTAIDDGAFDFQVISLACNIQFTEKGIFGVFKLKGFDDPEVKLVRVRVK